MSETRAQYGDGGEAREQQQAQHTPGPWKVRVDDYHGGMTVTDESGRSCVAMFPRYWLAHDEANAALIAAAPDLLKELRRMVETCEACDDIAPHLKGHIASARAVVAKATGSPGGESQPPAEPRELLCMLCSTEYAPWFAPNALWNAAVRRPDGTDEVPFLCPTCFTRQALLKGINQVFVLSTDTEPHEREAELTHENERLRAALRGMVEYRERWDMEEGHHDWCNALDGDDCTCGMDAARAALNHAAPAAQQEGE